MRNSRQKLWAAEETENSAVTEYKKAVLTRIANKVILARAMVIWETNLAFINK